MKILTSANVASLVNIMLKNARGTTTTTDGASAAGLTVSEDLNNLVDAGAELSNLLTMVNFRNVVTGMLEGVGRILYENAKESAPTRYNLFIDESEYLTVVEKVRISAIEFEQSYMYATSGGSSFADMFNNHPLTFSAKVWNTIGTYRTKPYTISMIQLRSSAPNPEELTRFLGEIYGVVEVTYRQALKEAEKRVVNAQMANCALYNSGARVVDLLHEYYLQTGNTLTVTATFDADTGAQLTESYRNSDDFKRWVYGYFKQLKLYMSEPSGGYNAEGNLIDTDSEDRRFALLSDFVTSVQTISKYQEGSNNSDALSDAIEVPFWQNRNERDKISCLPPEAPTITVNKHVTNVTISGVIGFMWDRRGTFLTSSKIETGYQENNMDKWTNYTHNFSVREMCDKGSNAILFVVCDPTGTNKAYTITEASNT